MLGEAETVNSQAATSGVCFSLIDIDIDITYANKAVSVQKHQILECTPTDDGVFAEVEYCLLIFPSF